MDDIDKIAQICNSNVKLGLQLIKGQNLNLNEVIHLLSTLWNKYPKYDNQKRQILNLTVREFSIIILQIEGSHYNGAVMDCTSKRPIEHIQNAETIDECVDFIANSIINMKLWNT